MASFRANKSFEKDGAKRRAASQLKRYVQKIRNRSL